MIRKLNIALAVALSVAACASAAKRVEQGQEFQRAGRPAEAAERYIQALKRPVLRTVSALIGVLLLVAGCGYVVSTLTFFLLPDYFRVVSLLMMLVAAAGEVSIVVWLLAKGARTEPMEDKARAAVVA